jgi:RNA polymerase sigma factor (sigma-70 family)
MGDVKAELPPFQSFLEKHRGPVLGFLRGMVGAHDADDVFQETFLAALRAYPRADGRNLRAWVLTIARRKAIDHHRARSRRPEPIPDPEPVATGNVEPDGIGGSEVWARVGELADGQREALALRYAADLPYREIGAALGTTEAAARQRVHDGLNALRKRIGTTSKEDV